ncbi:hypothetical protein TFLX_00247 [Thermoflexales bacterium]|nr:hypothetical protein TFLX_00247 [Thermoflexales bacterium]
MADPVNPYIAGNPVTGEAMFFGRESVFAFVRQALTGQHRDNVIVLYGQRRTGKTSSLYQMRRHLDARYLCIFVDLHGLALNGIDGFLWDLIGTIVRGLRKDYQIELPPLKRSEFKVEPRVTFENEFLPLVWNAIGDRHILLMLDEAIRLQEQIEAGKLDKSVFEYLRHLMQHFDRLNFLFSLGSGLEEMEKEYAFLFSVGLYRKISFLTRDAATALITQPVKDYYQIEPSAVDRIFSITSGHPYFTQLLCHSLFNQWLQHQRSPIRVDDVNPVLSEVVERGLAVLKQVWDDSTPGEKAVLAALVAAMGKRSHPIGLAEIDRAWANLNVIIPENEKARAMRSLIARDVIIGEDKYQFAVELQRMWIQKYEKLEWVKEEIEATLQLWRPPEVAFGRRRSQTDVLAIAVILGFFAALIIMLFLGLRSLNESVGIERAQRRTLEAQVTRIAEAVATATAAAEAPAATATAGAAQLYAEQLTSTAVAVECTLSDAAIDELLKRLNELRQQNGSAPVVLDQQLSARAAQISADRAAGAPQVFDPTIIVFQGCRLDNIWHSLSTNEDVRNVFISTSYSRVGLAITPGALNTLVFKFDRSEPTATPTPSRTSTPRPIIPPTPTATLLRYSGPLSFDWVIVSQGRNPANANQWLVVVNLVARGGDGQYSYYHDGLPVNGPRMQIVDQNCRNKPGSFWVQDGTGAIVKKSYYLFAPYCPGAQP